jgi:hypothetical protein
MDEWGWLRCSAGEVFCKEEEEESKWTSCPGFVQSQILLPKAPLPAGQHRINKWDGPCILLPFRGGSRIIPGGHVFRVSVYVPKRRLLTIGLTSK